MFTDTHCHFEKQYYDNFEEVINRAIDSKVDRFIVCGCSKESNKEAIELSNKYNFIYATIGYHPDQADIVTDDDISLLEKQIKDNKVIGIGEIGLDYHYEGYSKDKQFILFKKQLELAEKYNLPVVIHSRDAVQDTIDILKQYNVKGVIHSFSLSKEVANIYIGMGYKLGINGVVTFKNCNLINTLKEVGVNEIVFETDAPYMTPHPHRGEKNESKYIYDIADFVSKECNISLEELSKITNKNINEIFDI